MKFKQDDDMRLREVGTITEFRTEGQCWNMALEVERFHIPGWNDTPEIRWFNIPSEHLDAVRAAFSKGDKVTVLFGGNTLQLHVIENAQKRIECPLKGDR